MIGDGIEIERAAFQLQVIACGMADRFAQRIAIGIVRIRGYLAHRLGHARAVGQRQIPRGLGRFGESDGNFARHRLSVIIERLLTQIGHGDPEAIDG